MASESAVSSILRDDFEEVGSTPAGRAEGQRLVLKIYPGQWSQTRQNMNRKELTNNRQLQLRVLSGNTGVGVKVQEQKSLVLLKATIWNASRH